MTTQIFHKEYNKLLEALRNNDVQLARNSLKDIEELKLITMHYSTLEIRTLRQALQAPNALKRLWLCHGDLTGGESEELTAILNNNPQLLYLSLEYCKLQAECEDSGIIAVAEALPKLSQLEHLSLQGNRIANKGAAETAKALRGHPKLTRLNLGHNHIGNKGVAALIELVGSIPTFKEIDLSWNLVSDKGAKLILEALEANRAAVEASSLIIRLHGNFHVSDEMLSALKKAFPQNIKLQLLGEDGY